MIPLSKRIQALLDYSGMSITDFSRHLGLKSPNAIREIIKGRTKTLSDAVSIHITFTYPNINQEWLHKGVGEMFKTQQSKSVRDINGNNNFVQNDHSININELKVKIDDELANGLDMPSNVEELQNEVKKLRQLLSKAEKEIARLEGKVEQQNETIKMLIGK